MRPPAQTSCRSLAVAGARNRQGCDQIRLSTRQGLCPRCRLRWCKSKKSWCCPLCFCAAMREALHNTRRDFFPSRVFTAAHCLCSGAHAVVCGGWLDCWRCVQCWAECAKHERGEQGEGNSLEPEFHAGTRTRFPKSSVTASPDWQKSLCPHTNQNRASSDLRHQLNAPLKPCAACV